VTDWAAVRPVTAQAVKDSAIQFARGVVVDQNVVFDFLAPFEDEMRFYGSKLVSKPCEQAGVDVHKRT
jgi:hypothetical protein